jgi:hypothetical protein
MIDHQIDEEMILIDEVSDEALEAVALVTVGGFATLPHTYCFACPSGPPQRSAVIRGAPKTQPSTRRAAQRKRRSPHRCSSPSVPSAIAQLKPAKVELLSFECNPPAEVRVKSQLSINEAYRKAS